jgi:hypothetical protein
MRHYISDFETVVMGILAAPYRNADDIAFLHEFIYRLTLDCASLQNLLTARRSAIEIMQPW